MDAQSARAVVEDGTQGSYETTHVTPASLTTEVRSCAQARVQACGTLGVMRIGCAPVPALFES